MNVSVDNTAQNSTAGATELTWNHTISGLNRSLIVGVMYTGYVAGHISGVTFDSIPMTYIGSTANSFGALNIEILLFKLVSPPLGTYQVKVDADMSVGMMGISASVNSSNGSLGVTNQDAEYGHTMSASGGSEQYALSPGDAVIAFVCYDANGVGVPGADTTLIEQTAIGTSYGASMLFLPNPSGTEIGINYASIPGTGFLYSGVVLKVGSQGVTPFHEIRFDPRIVYGSTTSHEYSTSVVPVPSGDEYRRSYWAKGRRKWTISKQNLSAEAYGNLMNFFRGRRGRAYGFRIRDWHCYKKVKEPLPLLTATTAQLQFVYADPINPETQIVTKPVLVSDVNNDATAPAWQYSPDIILYRSDAPDTPFSTSNYTLDRTTGGISFGSSQSDWTFTWSGSFDFPARFDSDAAAVKRDDLNIHNWDDIVVIELKYPAGGGM